MTSCSYQYYKLKWIMTHENIRLKVKVAYQENLKWFYAGNFIFTASETLPDIEKQKQTLLNQILDKCVFLIINRL